MVEDPRGAVERVARQMGVALAPHELDAVCERSSFSHMKSIDERFYAGCPR